MTPLHLVIVLWLVCFNLFAFIQMGADKRKARLGRRRIPEKRLFLPVILFGSVGGILGMRLFHHKTRHKKFRFGFPSLLIVHIAVFAVLFYCNII